MAEQKKYCLWCGCYRYVLPHGVCGACDEDETYQNLGAHNKRMLKREVSESVNGSGHKQTSGE